MSHQSDQQAQTAQTVQAYFQAFNDQNPQALLELLHPEVRHDVNEGPTQTGREAFREFKAHMDRCYREQISDLVILTNPDHPTRACAEFTCSGTYLATDPGLPEATGQTYSIPAVATFEVKDQQITRVTSYYNLKAWTAAIAPPTSTQ